MLEDIVRVQIWLLIQGSNLPLIDLASVVLGVVVRIFEPIVSTI
jgi:hypothetical protein